jgi:hypothetical protein
MSENNTTGKVCLLICGIFKDDVNSSDYTVLNNTKINEKLIGKDMKGSGHGLIYSSILACL